MVRAQILSKSIVKFIQGFLKINAPQPNFDSIQVVPLTVTSMPKKIQQKLLQFGCATTQNVYHQGPFTNSVPPPSAISEKRRKPRFLSFERE